MGLFYKSNVIFNFFIWFVIRIFMKFLYFLIICFAACCAAEFFFKSVLLMPFKSVICVSLLKSTVSISSTLTPFSWSIACKSSVPRKPAHYSHLLASLFTSFRLPFCLSFWYFFVILLEARRILFGSGIIFTFLVHMYLNLQMEHRQLNL